MANPVFERQLSAIRDAMVVIEGEIARAESAHQRLDALRAQEREVKALLDELAPQVTIARRQIAAADETATMKIQEAERQRDHIIDSAHQKAKAIEIEAQKAALLVIEEAQKQAIPHVEHLAETKRQHEAATTRLNAINEQVSAAQEMLAKIKRQAAAFAAD